MLLRRQRWGRDEGGVAGRARMLLGAPPIYPALRTRGLRIEKVSADGVRGEWIVPPQAGSAVLLYIHGGGFVSCSAATHRPVTGQLARLTSSRVFAVDYRLAPEHRFPAALEDVFVAYRRLLDQGIPAAQISVAGDSAGGGLALSLLLKVRDEHLPLPACGVCLSPWTDLAGTGASVLSNDGKCALFRPGNVGEFAAAYLGDACAFEPYASPLHADLAGLPTVLLQVGSTELLLDDSRTVHQKIINAGGEGELEIYDDVAHGWHMLAGLVPEANDALAKAAAFILRHSKE